jgi:hypothetical protein
MSQRQRLKQLEKKAHAQFLAFFVLPRGLCNRREMEAQLWDDYVKNGGNKTATPAFLPNSKDHYGFVCCVEVAVVNDWLANNSKPPLNLGPI